MKRINKVAVLGAGTMGARIAAHFANAGVPSYLLDIVPPNVPPDAAPSARNKIAAAGLEAQADPRAGRDGRVADPSHHRPFCCTGAAAWRAPARNGNYRRTCTWSARLA